MRRQFLWILLFGVAAFVFTRLYRIDTGYFFFNDAGRDLMVLEEWVDTYKPPLLGPQNSALPFNQPAVYFYWLMPLYVATGFSLWSPLLTLILTMLAALGLTLRLFWQERRWWWVVLGVWWLSVVHPQYIIQNRFVWNPSFVPAFLTLGLLAWLSLRERWSRGRVFVAAGGLALAFSFSYSVVAILPLVVFLSWWQWRSDWKKPGIFTLLLTGAVAALQLPTVVFELRYNWQLTKAVIYGTDLTSTPIAFSDKLRDFLFGVLGVSGPDWLQWSLVGLFVGAVLANWWQIRTTARQWRDAHWVTLSALLAAVVAFMLAVPVSMHTHYIFGVTTLAFLVVACLRPPLALQLGSVLTLVWLQPSTWLGHFQPAPRTVEEVMACARQVCSQETDPLYVSLETDRFVFMHAGPEFRYALKRSGCQVRPIETQPGTAQHMAVVQDDGTYTHGKTSYYELSLFGPSRVAREYQCTDTLRVTILEATP